MTEPRLTIDNLRSFGVEPAYFGLGFIQLKINSTERVHFYHDDLPVLVDEPHNHRYGFTSHIMQGKFEQALYAFTNDPAGGHYMDFEDCSPDVSIEDHPNVVTGSMKEIFSAVYCAGDHYCIEADTLHTVRATNNAITYLVRDRPFKDFAGVVHEIGAEKVCPFSKPIPVNQCWEMIEDMLPTDHTQSINNPGYHLVDIPKGVIGEPSKIIEEALEIQDAHNQGINIMAHVEMSDLYGALDRYREKHHINVSMDDLAAMYNVTRRAFESGKRS
jgi:hypothetical protein